MAAAGKGENANGNLPCEGPLVTWKGSLQVFDAYSELMTHAIGEATVTWKKKGTQLPTHISLRPVFVPFETKLITPNVVETASSSSSAATSLCVRTDLALCHLYLIGCADHEEYRASVREELVAWFASLRDVNCYDWLIVVDSAKAKENRTRAPFMEALKKDFSKYQAKILEIDSGSAGIKKLVLTLKEQLSFAVDSLIASAEQALLADRENCKQIDWDFARFAEAQLALARLYRSLELHDQVLAKCDELESLFSRLVEEFVQKEPEVCPSLVDQVLVLRSAHDCSGVSRLPASFVQIRVKLLAELVAALLNVFDSRLRNQSAVPVSAQMQVHYCGLLLHYAHKCLDSFTEQSAILHPQFESSKRACWTVLFCFEVFYLCKPLCDPVQVDSARDYTCRLWIELCKAITRLSHQCGLNRSASTSNVSGGVLGVSSLLEWLPKPSQANVALTDLKSKSDDHLPVSKVRRLLKSHEHFAHMMQKLHESAIAVLKHFQWKRHSRLLGKDLADFLIACDRLEGALPYYLKLLNSFAKEGWLEAYAATLEHSLSDHFAAIADLFPKDYVDFCSCLAVNGSNELVRLEQANNFRDYLAARQNEPTPFRFEHRRVPQCPFRLQSGVDICPTSAIPNQAIVCRFSLVNLLPIELTNVKIGFCFRAHDDKQSAKKHNMSPRFMLSSTAAKEPTTATTCRFSCVSMGHRALAPRASDAVVMPADCPGHFVFTSSSGGNHPIEQAENDDHMVTLAPGINHIELHGKAGETGSYCADHLDVVIGGASFVVDVDRSLQQLFADGVVPKANERSPRFKVVVRPPFAELTPVDDRPLGGVAQRFTVCANSGTLAIDDESLLTVQVAEGSALVEFQQDDGSWSPQLSVCVPKLNPRESHTAEIALCCLLESLPDPNPVRAKFHLKWLDSSWKVEFFFRPVLYLSSRTTMLEDKVLLEVDAYRCCGSMTLVPVEAVLLQSRDTAQSPDLPSKLMNPSLQSMVPDARHNLVWTLPQRMKPKTSAEPVAPSEFRLMLRYRVLDEIEQFDREYRYCDRLILYDQSAEYELCCQITSQKPQQVLCRVDASCDLVVSLRSLRPDRRRLHTVFITLTADNTLWHMDERQKLLHVKESGLGQVAFAVTPKTVGYLPYPTVTLRSCETDGQESTSSSNNNNSNNGGTKKPTDDASAFGEELRAFVRTLGKQVFVLSALQKTLADNHKSRSTRE